MSKEIKSIDFCKTINEEDNVLIIDADGVVLDFFNSFFTFVKKVGYNIDTNRGYLLEDVCLFPDGKSIRDSSESLRDAGEKISNLLSVFFSSYSYSHNMPAIKDSVEYLKILRNNFKIVCVTNIPEEFVKDRAINFDTIGIPFIDVISNSGSKKPVYEEIRKRTNGIIINVDDMPKNVVDSIETELCELSNGIVFSGGFTCHNWEETYPSSRMSIANNWCEINSIIEYYLERHISFKKCAEKLGITTDLFLSKYRGSVSYTAAKETDDPIGFMLKRIRNLHELKSNHSS